MKRIQLFVLLSSLPAIVTVAQQNVVPLSGQVTDIDLLIPVSNHTVYAALNDSLGFYEFQTDEEGYYRDTIFLNTLLAESVMIYTFDCNYMMHDTLVTDLTGPIVANFTICSDSLPQECWASFIYYPDSLDLMTFHFVDMSYLPDGTLPDSWFWDFDDGTASDEQNPTHTYSGEGIYVVCLTISDAESNCENTMCMELMVLGGPSDCENAFMYTTNDGYTFAFTGTASSPNPVSYFWDFGDGSYGEGQNVTHTYPPDPPLFMYYNICLTTFTIDSTGDSCMDITCQEVWVGGNPMDCQAWFYYYPVADSLNQLAFQFFDSSMGLHDAWLWDFGDGESSSLPNPIHIWADSGVYMVCLTIWDSAGTCESMYCEDVYAGGLPPFDCYNYFNYYLEDSLTVTFIGEVYGGGMLLEADTYVWDFGDGTTGEGQTVTHTYPPGGSEYYTVCLITTWLMDSTLNDSCYAVSCQTIGVGGGCEDQFTLTGQVIMGNTFADIGQVSLYLANPSGEMMLLAIQPIDSIGHFFFTQVGEGNYYLLAELLEGSSGFGNFLPTYYIDAVTWTDADMITLGEPVNPYDIYLVSAGDYNPGAGEINGTVNASYGLFRDGEPVTGIEIILMDQGEEPIEYAYSSDLGSFGFPSLAWGTYKVHAEVPGKVTDPAWITLNEEHPLVIVEFTITQTEVYNTLSVEEPHPCLVSVGEVYPNPVSDVAVLPVRLTEKTLLSVAVYDQLGQQVWGSYKTCDAGDHLINLNISNLNNGVYILSVGNDTTIRVIKRIVK